MKRFLNLLIFLTICFGSQAQKQNCSVALNHFLITVDSTTYQAILDSNFLNSNFSYAYERTKFWEGIYIIGQDNYIEIFHPNSFVEEKIPIGLSWICHASMVANCTGKYDLPDNKQITYTLNDAFDELSVKTQDSVYLAQDFSSLMTTREMKKNQYESWTKKTFNDSLIFITTDYNSPAESDSSKNHLFNNITGISINLNNRDSLSITQYLNVIGYTIESNIKNRVKYSNSIDFVELDFVKHVEFASVSAVYFKLNQYSELKRIALGNSEIVLDGTEGKWELNKQKLKPIKL